MYRYCSMAAAGQQGAGRRQWRAQQGIHYRMACCVTFGYCFYIVLQGSIFFSFSLSHFFPNKLIHSVLGLVSLLRWMHIKQRFLLLLFVFFSIWWMKFKSRCQRKRDQIIRFQISPVYSMLGLPSLSYSVALTALVSRCQPFLLTVPESGGLYPDRKWSSISRQGWLQGPAVQWHRENGSQAFD